MRELAIEGTRTGKAPRTTIPARSTGGRPDLLHKQFVAPAPNLVHVADITYVKMSNGSFAYVAFITDVFSRRIVGWAVSTSLKTERVALPALEESIHWAALHGNTQGLIHHSDHGVQYISQVYSKRVQDYGMLSSTGTIGDSSDNALAERTNNAYKTELIRVNPPYESIEELEYDTFQWVTWFNTQRLHQSLGYKTPQQVEEEYYMNYKVIMTR